MAGIEIAPNTAYTHPAWAKDYFGREHVFAGGARVDATQFARSNSVDVTLTADAAAGAVALVVTALSGPIPAGVVLRFTGNQLAYLTVDALAGATSVTVAPLGFLIPSGSTSQWRGTGRVWVRSGTLLGRTNAERDAGTPYGPAAAADDEIFILCYDIDDAIRNPDAELYRPGGLVDIVHLWSYAAAASGIKTKLASTYQLMRGAD